MMKSKATSKFFDGQLYERMSYDLHLGGMSERTHAGYVRAVRQLADYCRTALDKITEDQLRRHFLFLKNEKKFAYGSLRVAYSGIKFFYTRTCKRDWQTLAQMKPVPHARVVCTIRSRPTLEGQIRGGHQAGGQRPGRAQVSGAVRASRGHQRPSDRRKPAIAGENREERPAAMSKSSPCATAKRIPSIANAANQGPQTLQQRHEAASDALKARPASAGLPEQMP